MLIPKETLFFFLFLQKIRIKETLLRVFIEVDNIRTLLQIETFSLSAVTPAPLTTIILFGWFLRNKNITAKPSQSQQQKVN